MQFIFKKENPVVTTWMNLGDFMLREISQAQRDKMSLQLLHVKSKNAEFIEAGSRWQLPEPGVQVGERELGKHWLIDTKYQLGGKTSRYLLCGIIVANNNLSYPFYFCLYF